MEITLALGGGGVRGVAHVGVLRCLENEGYQIRAVAGTSAGGIVAAFYAAGFSPDEIAEKISKVNQSKMFGRKPADGPSLMGLAGLTHLLNELLGEKTFAEMRLPLAVAAVDLKTGQEVVLHHGKVVPAILASAAVPGIFPPIVIEDTLLADGGVVDPVPVSIARWLAPDLPVVAVALNQAAPNPLSGHPTLPIPIPGPAPIIEQVARMRIAQAFNIFLRSTEIGSLALTELRLQIDRPEVLIRPDVERFGLLEHISTSEVVLLGELAMQRSLPDLMKAVSWTSRVGRRFRRNGPPEITEDTRHDVAEEEEV